MNVGYLDYKKLKEFYTIPELCELFEMTKSELRSKCEQYHITPTRNEIGEAGFTKYDVRKLHTKLCYEELNQQKEWDPWA